MINDVKLIYITCGFLRLICSVLLTVCSHFKVNLSIGQFISFQKEQRLLPVFPLLNATVRIIEPLATTFRKELLRIKCRFDSCRERFQNEDSSFLYSATVLVLFFYFSFLLTKTTTPITAIQATQKITYDFEYLKIHISLQPDLSFKSSSNLWLSQNLFLRNTNIELQFIDI